MASNPYTTANYPTEAEEWLTQTVRGLARAHHITITEARRLTRHVHTIEEPDGLAHYAYEPEPSYPQTPETVITWDGDTPEQAITLYLNVTRDIARELDITPEQARLLTDTCVTRRGDTYKATVGTITDTSKSVKGALGNLHGTLRPAIQTAVTTLHLTPWDVWHAAIGTRIIEHTDKTDTRHVLLGDAIGEGADTPATIMDAIHLNDPNPAHTLADKLGTTIEHAADMLSHVERPEDAGDDFAYGMRIIEPPLNEPRWIRGHGRTPMLAVLDAKRIADNAKPPIA